MGIQPEDEAGSVAHVGEVPGARARGEIAAKFGGSTTRHVNTL